jgi:threonine dehydrogenase-like Zn-dependent dehydrogenase
MLSVHLENGRVEVRDVPVPSRPPDYGFAGTPGHEFAGEVVAADTPSLPGRRVAGEINLACGGCEWCARNMGRHCPQRTVLGIVKHPGAFQEFFTLPERNLHLLPDSISNEQAVFIEPLAAACEILDQVQIPCASKVAVLGDGKLGLLIAQALNAHGYPVYQFGRHPEKLDIARRAGVHTEIATALPAAAYNWVVDATGSPEGLQAAVRMVRPRGTVILKSTQHGLVKLDTAPVIVNEIALVGSRCGRFEPAIELLGRGLINVHDMISAREKLADAPLAFERAARKGMMKVLLS